MSASSTQRSNGATKDGGRLADSLFAKTNSFATRSSKRPLCSLNKSLFRTESANRVVCTQRTKSVCMLGREKQDSKESVATTPSDAQSKKLTRLILVFKKRLRFLSMKALPSENASAAIAGNSDEFSASNTRVFRGLDCAKKHKNKLRLWRTSVFLASRFSLVASASAHQSSTRTAVSRNC